MPIAMTPKRAAAIKARAEAKARSEASREAMAMAKEKQQKRSISMAASVKARAEIRERQRKRTEARRASIATVTGKMLLAKRESLKLSQKEVAKELGFSQVFLGRIEFGKVDLPIKYVGPIARVLKLSKDDIIFSLKFDLNNKIDQRAKR